MKFFAHVLPSVSFNVRVKITEFFAAIPAAVHIVAVNSHDVPDADRSMGEIKRNTYCICQASLLDDWFVGV